MSERSERINEHSVVVPHAAAERSLRSEVGA
jgi:hypothetical protein